MKFHQNKVFFLKNTRFQTTCEWKSAKYFYAKKLPSNRVFYYSKLFLKSPINEI
jgi:hypothetical protein